ncbi:MAG: Na+:solute symporter [Planctomycetes bacterium]|nr:Na+:solute symporter [Planctomycetota bacterium]
MGDKAVHLAALDWAVIVGYLALALGAGLLIARRSRGDVENFFLSGRSLPWWLAGTSMVATSFASDTPLVVAGWTRAGGVAGNWRWWAYLVSTLLVVMLFARYWQRSRVMTDVEFMELRYSGPQARFLRGFKSVYQCVFLHCFVMGWVILGMTKVLVVLFDLGDEPARVMGMSVGLTWPWVVMIGCALLALVYSEVSGLWGVVLTDFVQFLFALAGAVMLMVVVVEHFGGLGPLTDQLRATAVTAGKLSSAPDTGGVGLTDVAHWPAEALRTLVLVCVIWIASKNADGSGVMVQRVLACKNEKHALGATLWYAVAHFAIRPWPWILVALASLLVFPSASASSPVDGRVRAVFEDAVLVAPADGGEARRVEIPDTGVDGWTAEPTVEAGDEVRAGQAVASTDDERAYPAMMRRFLPAGLLGLLVASFLAAFMSTIDTHVNLASSYLVNDLYRRFLHKDADPAHYVRAARVTGPAVLVLALVFAAASSSVREMFDVFTELFSGMGVVYVGRWLWWRVNAWSEVAALATGALATWLVRTWPQVAGGMLPARLLDASGGPVFEGRLLLVLAASLLVVIPVTLLTPPVERECLQVFHDRVRPLGFWGPLRSKSASRQGGVLVRVLLGWLGAVAFVVAIVLLPGKIMLERDASLGLWIGVAVVGALLTIVGLSAASRAIRPGSPDAG